MRSNSEIAPCIEQSAEEFRSVLDLLPQLVWSCGVDGHCDFFNKRWSEFTGVPLEQLLGMGWRETMHPEDRVSTCDYWYAALRGEVDYDLDYRLRRLDGAYCWFKTRATPWRNRQGEIVKWFGTCTDVQEQKELEERLRESDASQRLLIENARDFAIYSTDPSGIVRTWNPGAQRLFGYESREILGQNTKILFTPEDQAGGEAEKEMDTARREGCAMDERWHMRKNGERFFASGAVRPLLDGDGKLIGFLKVARDITPKRAEKELLENTVRDRTRELRETVRELEAFSYSVAHDLRSPLRAMQAYATLLLESAAGRLDSEQLDYLRQIARSATRLDALIRDLLDYSRTAREEAPLGIVDLDQLVRDMLVTYPQFQPPNADIRIEGRLPRVLGNSTLLTQCISNLLSNGVKFVPRHRHPEIVIRAEEGSPRPGCVRLCFKDNGIGIAPEHHDRVFRIFERLRPAQEFEGTGIGLAIVRKAAERMGGQVGFDSLSGIGSIFWIELQMPG